MPPEISQRAEVGGFERRFHENTFEVRSSGEGGITFDGIASVVDTPYEVNDMFGTYSEIMAAGAFDRTIKHGADVRLLVNHDASSAAGIPLARTKPGSLILSANPDLRAVASLNGARTDVANLAEALKDKAIDQMSIGFRVSQQSWSPDYTERTIKEVQLFDVSIVAFPASPTTSASVRSIDEALRMIRSDEIDEDEIERAIAYLRSLRPQAEVNPFAKRDQMDRDRADALKFLTPAAF